MSRQIERDRPAKTEEIEVTDEMINAGREDLWSYNRERDGAGDAALRAIFRAMWLARPIRERAGCGGESASPAPGATTKVFSTVLSALEVDATVYRDWLAADKTRATQSRGGGYEEVYRPLKSLVLYTKPGCQ
jgi:hypothetical protein